MKYNFVGRTGLKVSEIGLGCMSFGRFNDEKESFKILDEAIENGINLFDTADIYGKRISEDGIGDGLSEEIIGRWLAQDRKRRNKIVLATKVYGKMGDGPNDGGLSAYHIKRACEESLRRLKTDHIDLYQLHVAERYISWEEKWQAMEQLVREGKITYIGSSNHSAGDIAIAQCAAKSRNFFGIISEQCRYNLTYRDAELEVLPICKRLGVGIFTHNSLAAGILAGKYNRDDKVGRRVERSDLGKKYMEQINQYEKLCKGIGIEPALVATAWLVQNPIVTAPLIGIRTVKQLRSTLGAIDITLPEEVLDKLDSIWPGPKGEYPFPV